ncbi:MAG: hypothetical protein ACR2PL_16235 [Dehalococcoidia bacterium]
MEVILADEIVLRPDAIRAIKVPFTVGPTSLVEVATMIDNAQCRMQEGTYSLIFEMGRTDYDDLWCYFVFLPDTNPTAEILRADADLAP